MLPTVLRPAERCRVLDPYALISNNDTGRVHRFFELCLMSRRMKYVDRRRRGHDIGISLENGMQKPAKSSAGISSFIILPRPSSTRRSETLSMATLYGGSVTTSAAFALSMSCSTSA
ncbi:hypothetical protein [Cohnella cellulosilytica]|uniref:hypothetical protein n=1 Tax=Cohnella cellulosilytica TaxID=986710 RepID=UPI00366C9E4E